MSWKKILHPEINDFIVQNEQKNVADLALKKPPQKEWPYKEILDQIKARQKARKKINAWLEKSNDIIFGSADLVEQASSFATALFKAKIIQEEYKKLISKSCIKDSSFCDLTAGLGVDFWAIAPQFKNAIANDICTKNAEILKHNLDLLFQKEKYIPEVEIHNKDAKDFIKNMSFSDVVFIDPQRRENATKGKYIIADCKPNILELIKELENKTVLLCIKFSSMLDIHQAIKEIGEKRILSIHLVQWDGQCKELLVFVKLADKTAHQDPEKKEKAAAVAAIQNKALEQILICAHEINASGNVVKSMSYMAGEETNISEKDISFSQPQKYIFEPGPAFLKSGAFKLFCKKYNLAKLHTHTHLYTSDKLCPEFPGKTFEFLGSFSALQKTQTIKKANIISRNFPEKAEILHKKLKIKPGGPYTIIACTVLENKKALYWTKAL